MFSYSHERSGSFRGTYPTAQDALIAGRGQYGSDTTIYVGQLRQATYSDVFIGADTLLSYMKEDATDKVGDEGIDCFDLLPDEAVSRLDGYLRDAIEEWETDLDAEHQFSGRWIDRVRAYAELEEVRVNHFK